MNDILTFEDHLLLEKIGKQYLGDAEEVSYQIFVGDAKKDGKWMTDKKYAKLKTAEIPESNLFKYLLTTAGATILVVLSVALYKFVKKFRGKRLLQKMDTDLVKQMDKYSTQLDDKIDKKEMIQLWKIFAGDKKLKMYFWQLKAAETDIERNKISKLIDKYLRSKMSSDLLMKVSKIKL